MSRGKTSGILPQKFWNKLEIIHYSHRGFTGITVLINSIPTIRQASKSVLFHWIKCSYFGILDIQDLISDGTLAVIWPVFDVQTRTMLFDLLPRLVHTHTHTHRHSALPLFLTFWCDLWSYEARWTKTGTSVSQISSMKFIITEIRAGSTQYDVLSWVLSSREPLSSVNTCWDFSNYKSGYTNWRDFP